MSISVRCQCGKQLAAKQELAGKQVKCPACGNILRIPRPQPAEPQTQAGVAVACACGSQFRAAPHLYGKRVACPACGGPLSIPSPGLAPLQPLNALDDDPLGLPTDHSAPTATRQLPTKRLVQPRSQMPLNPRHLIVAGVVLAVLIIVVPLVWIAARTGIRLVVGAASPQAENTSQQSEAEAEPQGATIQDSADGTATLSSGLATKPVEQAVEQKPPQPSAFRYGWQVGQDYRYDYTMKADLMGQAITGNGHITYSPAQIGEAIAIASAAGDTTGANGAGTEPQVALSYAGSLQMKWPQLPESSGGGPFGGEPAGPPRPAGGDPFGGGPFGGDPFGGGPGGGDPFARRPGRSAPDDSPNNENGKIVVDVAGEYLQGDMKVFLPFVMTPLGLLAIEPLGNGEPTWNRERPVSLAGKEEREDFSPFGGFHPSAMDPFAARGPARQQQPAEMVTAKERYEYRWGDSTGDTVVLLKTYSLETLQPKDDQLNLNVTGNGQIVFDKRAAVPQSMTYSADFVLQQGSISIMIPVTFSYQRANP